MSRCAKCFSPHHDTEHCTAYAVAERKEHRCPGCFNLLTKTDLEKHAQLGCVNENHPVMPRG